MFIFYAELLSVDVSNVNEYDSGRVTGVVR